jgi:predicted RNase H-like nuclease
MTTKFNNLYESILNDLAASATLTPVGPLTVTSEIPDADCLDCDEEIQEEISETEIASQIIKHIKKLRKQLGEDTYYRARKIQDLAEKLLEMHPEIEIVESEPVE